LNHDLPKKKSVLADPDFLLVFPVSDNNSDGDRKPWTGWSMTHGEVVTGFSPHADFKVNVTEPKSYSKGTQKGTHIQAHGMFPCNRCGRSYVRKDSLQHHLEWECGKEPTFQCPFCPQRCKRKAYQICHIRRQHSDMIDCVVMDVIPGITEAVNE
jgi:hypothetical protein